MIRRGSPSGARSSRVASSSPGTSRCSSVSRATASPARRRASSRTPSSSLGISSNRSSTCSPGASSSAIRTAHGDGRGRTGWLPWLVEELDYRHWRLWEAKEFWADKGGIALETKPSELFQRQIYATFQEDYVAMSLMPFFGEGHLLWATDYPHPDSVWPNSRDAIERQMRHLSPEMRRKLTHDNAAALYGLGGA